MSRIKASAAENQTVKSKGCVLYLFIAGSTPRSQRAVINIKALCDEALFEIAELKVIDIFQQPNLAKAEQIIAVPTLVRKLPQPKRLFIGDLSDKATILEVINS